MSRFGPKYDAGEVLELVERVLDAGGNLAGAGAGAPRVLYALRRGERRVITHTGADRLLTGVGRPDLLYALTPLDEERAA